MTAISLDEAIDQARQMLRAGDEEGAPTPEQSVAICRAVLGHYPNQPEAQHLLGLGLLRLGDAEGAERAFAGALQSDPRDAPSLWELGLLAESRDEMEPALAYAQAAWEIDPWCRDWREHVILLSQSMYGSDGRLQLTRAALASIHYRAGLWERTVDSCAEVVSQLGERLDVQLLMAAALCREGRFGWAAASCRDVLDRAPNAVDALLLLAEVERRQGNLAEAGWLRERAFAIDPSPDRVTSLLAFAGDESRAFFQATKAVVDLAPQPIAAGRNVFEQPTGAVVGSRTEDRLIAMEDLSSAGEMPELVELPQMPDWTMAPDETPTDRSTVPLDEPDGAVTPRAETEMDQNLVVPEPPQTEAAQLSSDTPEHRPQSPDDLDVEVVQPDANAHEPDLDELQPGAALSLESAPGDGDVVEPLSDVDIVRALETTDLDDASEDAFAPWIPPAMAPPSRFSVTEPTPVDTAPKTQPGHSGPVPAVEESGLDSQPDEVRAPAPDTSEFAVPSMMDEGSISDDPAAELERLRQRSRENPDAAAEIAVGLEALIERFPDSNIIPAAHRLAGSIYRKQGKSAQASLHYRLSLAATRKRND